jgi:DNA-binding transcriptional LysR family regulator
MCSGQAADAKPCAATFAAWVDDDRRLRQFEAGTRPCEALCSQLGRDRTGLLVTLQEVTRALMRRGILQGRWPRRAGHRGTGSIEGVKKAVINEVRAIGLLPAYAVTDELRAATIAPVNLRPAPPTMRLDALLSPSRARHPSTEELLVAISR